VLVAFQSFWSSKFASEAHTKKVTLHPLVCLVARRASRIATWSRIRFISSFKAYLICNTNVTFARMHHRIIFELYVDNECAYSILDHPQILTEILQRKYLASSSHSKFISNSATFVFPSETSSFNHWDFILNFIHLYIETKTENYFTLLLL